MEGGIPKSEVEKWDLQDIDDFTALLQMKADYKMAYDAYLQEQSGKET